MQMSTREDSPGTGARPFSTGGKRHAQGCVRMECGGNEKQCMEENENKVEETIFEKSEREAKRWRREVEEEEGEKR